MNARTEIAQLRSDRGGVEMAAQQAQSTTSKACQHVAEILTEITEQVRMDLRLRQVLIDLASVCVTAIAKDAQPAACRDCGSALGAGAADGLCHGCVCDAAYNMGVGS